jgi:hypothetical protein
VASKSKVCWRTRKDIKKKIANESKLENIYFSDFNYFYFIIAVEIFVSQSEAWTMINQINSDIKLDFTRSKIFFFLRFSAVYTRRTNSRLFRFMFNKWLTQNSSFAVNGKKIPQIFAFLSLLKFSCNLPTTSLYSRLFADIPQSNSSVNHSIKCLHVFFLRQTSRIIFDVMFISSGPRFAMKNIFSLSRVN